MTAFEYITALSIVKGKGKGKATLFIHGLCLKLEACGAVYMKQISNKHNMIKNPNWQEADQLAIYKHDRGFELGTTENRVTRTPRVDDDQKV